MQASKFEHFLKRLDALTRRQRDRVLAMLLPTARLDRTITLI